MHQNQSASLISMRTRVILAVIIGVLYWSMDAWGPLLAKLIFPEPDKPATLMHPTVSELTNRGHYVFILPDEVLHDNGWTEVISLYSWDAHCGVLLGDSFNPIRIAYEDNEANKVFVIQLAWRLTWPIPSDAEIGEHELDRTWVDLDKLKRTLELVGIEKQG